MGLLITYCVVMIALFIITLVAGNAVIDNNPRKANKWVFVMFTVSVLSTCFFYLCANGNTHVCTDTPTALDVYRGNTTLRVDYSIIGGDTIQGDTTVMYKSQIIKFDVE